MSIDKGLKFSSIKAANEAAKAGNNKQPSSFCPLIKGTCRKDCECFLLAEGYTDQGGEHFVSPGYCSNAMFIGSACNYG